MRYYNTICPNCLLIIHWKGSNTFLTKNTYPICEKCFYPTTEMNKSIDNESPAFLIFINKLFTIL